MKIVYLYNYYLFIITKLYIVYSTYIILEANTNIELQFVDN